MARPLALTLGEPAGIGPDLALAVWGRRVELDLPTFYIIGDLEFLARRAHHLGLDVPLRLSTPRHAAEAFEDALPVVDIGCAVTASPAHPDESSGPAAIASIRLGAKHVLAGEAAAIITNPVAKNVLYRSGFSEPGHTEYLARLATEAAQGLGGVGAAAGAPPRAVMMLWSPELAVVPVTIHLPLAQVSAALNVKLIVETGRITAHDLARRFAISRPRLAVAGLNPHAGEEGAMGSEDVAIVRPAVELLRAEGIDARGPLPADTMFHPGARATYDVALCMYHDQALIPIKTLAFDHGVNVTLGLPFVRTSPDHGTAFDIAGTGRADPSSLIAAVRLAARLAAREEVLPDT
jgi:4-hydroxythreonine-4-phosphate dehydrogenase